MPSFETRLREVFAADLCEGSDRQKSFSTGDQIGAGDLSGAARARVTCPVCKQSLVGRIIKNDHGVRLPTPMVRVPKHKPNA